MWFVFIDTKNARNSFAAMGLNIAIWIKYHTAFYEQNCSFRPKVLNQNIENKSYDEQIR